MTGSAHERGPILVVDRIDVGSARNEPFDHSYGIHLGCVHQGGIAESSAIVEICSVGDKDLRFRDFACLHREQKRRSLPNIGRRRCGMRAQKLAAPCNVIQSDGAHQRRPAQRRLVSARLQEMFHEIKWGAPGGLIQGRNALFQAGVRIDAA